MNEKKQILDSNGNPVKEGDTVRLLNVSVDLLKDLPSSDKLAIQDKANKTLVVQGFDEYNHIELEFSDMEGNTHFIWVEPKDIRKEET